MARPEELVLARPDSAGELHLIGLSLPLSPGLRTAALVVEVETEPTVTTFCNRLRPRVRRLRPRPHRRGHRHSRDVMNSPARGIELMFDSRYDPQP